MIQSYLSRSAAAQATLAQNADQHQILCKIAMLIVTSLRNGGKLLIAGNGGSASDAQHIAVEFLSRLMFDRAPLAAIALTQCGPFLTACGNDYGFDQVFARQIEGLARPGDIFWGFSTSGNSPNILAGAQAAQKAGCTCIGFTGQDGGKMREGFDPLFCAPSDQAQIIQQLHITAAHAVLAVVESKIFLTP